MGKKLNALTYERQVLFEEKYTEYSVFYRLKNIQLTTVSVASFIYI